MPDDQNWRFTPCADEELMRRLAELADAGMAFLGRDTVIEPAAAIRARLDCTDTQLFTVASSDGDPVGIFGVTTSSLNPYQAAIDVALPGADQQTYLEVIAAALRLCRSHLAIRTILRFEQSRDDRTEHFDRAGLRLLGTLREASYAEGGYHDQRVWLGATG